MLDLSKAAHFLLDTATSLEKVTQRHQEITQELIGCTTPNNSDDLMSLILFNGYYALDIKGVENAFFTIDGNMHMNETLTSPSFHIDLIFCLDGQNPFTVPFNETTGSFKNGNLIVNPPAIITESMNIDLQLTRPTQDTEIVAKISGNVITTTAENSKTYPINGATYNNPIFYDTYIGNYHEELLKTWEWLPIAEINEGYKLSYNYLTNKPGELTQVPSYSYNLNMYFFSFDDGDYQNKLIMGTSPEAGLVSNNMIVNKKVKGAAGLTQRSVQTVNTHETIGKANLSSATSESLAKFSGYYPLPSPYQGGFICIEGSYIINPKLGDSPIWAAKVGVSTDGKTAAVFNSTENISFENGVLSINIPLPEKEKKKENIVAVTLTREYQIKNHQGSLVSLTGTVKGQPVSSANSLNPVPLKGYSSTKMTGKPGSTYPVDLSISESGVIIYNGHTISSLTYVPVMYIAAFDNPEKKYHTVVLSLGTNSQKGMACIVSDVLVPPQGDMVTTAVWALPNEPAIQSDGKAA